MKLVNTFSGHNSAQKSSQNVVYKSSTANVFIADAKLYYGVENTRLRLRQKVTLSPLPFALSLFFSFRRHSLGFISAGKVFVKSREELEVHVSFTNEIFIGIAVLEK